MSTFKIDASHSEVSFKIKHLMITNVTGHFNKFEGTMESDKEDFSDAKINFEADIDSIDTKAPDRDAHLKSDDFFKADEFPKLTFVSTDFKKVDGEEYLLTGDLTLRGVTKPVDLKVEYGGTVTDPWGNLRAGFEINGKISRGEFGLKWGGLTEAGGVVLGDDVKLHINIEMVKQA